MSCHITSVTLSGSPDNFARQCIVLEDMKNGVENCIKDLNIYSVLTIRSASVVGNAKAIGVGLLGSVSIYYLFLIYNIL